MFLHVALIFVTMVLTTKAGVTFDFSHTGPLATEIKQFFLNASADSGNYGPLYIRLAWHCTGTYRASDGRGGCDGGRIRFPPESEWGSNNNLDNALLWITPIYEKYVPTGLSWSDFIVFVGNTAIESMGGPTIPFCPGRIDDMNGVESELLDNEDIYLPAWTVDPEEVRESFVVMDFNDRETVALIGGGHAFGQCHLATSGFEGVWTKEPTRFTNQFFTNLLNVNYTLTNAVPGDASSNIQYVNVNENLFMLGTDFALLFDPEYKKLVDEYAADEAQLSIDFGNAWHKLTNRDMGGKYCKTTVIAPPTIDYAKISAEVLAILPSADADFGTYAGFFVRLAWHCAGTYRSTDHYGGCNGARIRFDPEINWGSNAGLQEALDLLQPIKDNNPTLSWGDLIIIAGTESLTSMGAPVMPFCAGRVDVMNGDLSEHLEDEIYLDAEIGTAAEIRETMTIMGMNEAEITVLTGGGHTIGKCHVNRSGFEGAWTSTPTTFDNSFFKTLLDETWIETHEFGKRQYTDEAGNGLTMLHTDVQLREDLNFKRHVEIYAANNDLFLDDFASAWIKLVNADRFGFMCPTYNGTSNTNPTTSSPTPPSTVQSHAESLNVVIASAVTLFFMILK